MGGQSWERWCKGLFDLVEERCMALLRAHPAKRGWVTDSTCLHISKFEITNMQILTLLLKEMYLSSHHYWKTESMKQNTLLSALLSLNPKSKNMASDFSPPLGCSVPELSLAHPPYKRKLDLVGSRAPSCVLALSRACRQVWRRSGWGQTVYQAVFPQDR